MTPFYRFVRGVLIILLKLFMPVEAIGIEELPQEGPVVVCANHMSFLDPILLAIPCNRQLHFMAKIELFKFKFFKWFFEKLGAFPVDRNKNDIGAIKKALSILKRRDILAIFLEGTRTREINLDGAKEGAALLADRSNSQILPVFIDSKYRLFSKTLIVFRPLIDPKDYSEISKQERYRKIALDTMKAIYGVETNDENYSC